MKNYKLLIRFSESEQPLQNPNQGAKTIFRER